MRLVRKNIGKIGQAAIALSVCSGLFMGCGKASGGGAQMPQQEASPVAGSPGSGQPGLVIPPGVGAQIGLDMTPNDPSFSRQQYLTAIGAVSAWDVFFQPKTGINQDVVIAVIDSGVEIRHEDLKANVWVNRGEIPANGIDDDNNGYIDDVNGYNFASNIASPLPQESSANAAWQWTHGTRVAGLAAAVSNNNVGISGVDGRAKIMALNIMGTSAGFSTFDTTRAIYYAVNNGATVINLSLGGPNHISASFEAALRYATSRGVVVLAAAGNESMAIDQNYDVAGMATSIPGVVSVGNFQAANYQIDPQSNYSTNYVLLGAPGIYDLSTWLLTTSPESLHSYAGFAGTSAATPIAAGAAALAIGLIKSRGYSYTSGEIVQLLLDSARKVASLRGYFRDGNALDLARLAALVDSRYPAKGE